MAERYEDFGKRLTKLLYKSGHTQKELAQYLKVSTATTSMWCMGKTFPRPDKQKQIAFFLGVSVSELMDNDAPEDKIDRSNSVIQKIVEKIVDKQLSKVLDKYVELDEEGQKDVDKYIDYLLDKKNK